ncbi:MAG: hotdog fold thioesterase [Brumimicrobium sp.]|nr:hotdog fold thioesterase [Brumimicrobium sp.]
MTPKAIVEKMMQGDHFSQWLGIEVLGIQKGYCLLQMTVKPDMVNGFSIAHGGISYSLADSALAFASNSYGFHAVSIETSVSHTRPVNISDVLTAECTELNRGKTIGIYQVKVVNQSKKTVALFKGTVHISSREWE